MTVLLEVCVESVCGAVHAVEAGAHRLELCSALSLGGLTPSIGLIKETRKVIANVPVHVLIRPRPGDFIYSPSEIRTVLVDVEEAIKAGADGIVFGCLTPRGEVDVESLEAVLSLCRGHGVGFTFHRAFDSVADMRTALELLIQKGVPRVLTSGGAPTAALGEAQLAQLVGWGEGRIEVMAGGGIRPANVASVVQATGVREVHSSCCRLVESIMQYRNPSFSLTSSALPGPWQVQETDPNVVASMVKELQSLETPEALETSDVGWMQ